MDQKDIILFIIPLFMQAILILFLWRQIKFLEIKINTMYGLTKSSKDKLLFYQIATRLEEFLSIFDFIIRKSCTDEEFNEKHAPLLNIYKEKIKGLIDSIDRFY